MDLSLSTSNSSKKNLTIRVLIFSVIVFVLDFCTGVTLKHFHSNVTSGSYGTLNKLIHRFEEDIIVMGSSRAKHHYNSLIIQENTNLKCYNAGLDGRGILLTNILTAILLKKHKPKLIIIDINFMNRSFNEEFEKLDLIRPYYKSFNDVKALLDSADMFERLKQTSKTYPYNSMIGSIAKANLTQVNVDINQGFEALKGNLNMPYTYSQAQNKNILDQRLLKLLFKTCELCKVNNVKVIVCISPSLAAFNNQSIKTISEELKTRSISFYNFSKFANLDQQNLFYDLKHLNEIGAAIYSKKIAVVVKENLKKEN